MQREAGIAGYMEKLFFIMFAVTAVVAALAVISLKNPVHGALALMVTFFQVACIFVLLRAPFLAAAQLFIYVGAVMVLFLFVVLVLDMEKAALEVFPRLNRWFAYVVSPLVAIEFFIVIWGSAFKDMLPPTSAETSVKEFGKALFTDYLLPFEVVSVLLLAAMVGAIVMAKKRWN